MATKKRALPRVGDTVRRLSAGPGSPTGNMDGIVEVVTPKPHMSGGSTALLRVRWASGSIGLHADQQIAVVGQAQGAVATAIQAKLDQATRELVRNGFAPTSTSAFSNAATMAKAQGVAGFVEQATSALGYCRAVEDAKAEVARLDAAAHEGLTSNVERGSA